MKKWSIEKNVKTEPVYIGILEFQDNQGEYHNFEIMRTNKRIMFGGSTNTGFLESGYMPYNDEYSVDDHLQDLLDDLATYYNDGKEYCSVIICNDRM